MIQNDRSRRRYILIRLQVTKKTEAPPLLQNINFMTSREKSGHFYFCSNVLWFCSNNKWQSEGYLKEIDTKDIIEEDVHKRAKKIKGKSLFKNISVTFQ